jgi:hypothetical protein
MFKIAPGAGIKPGDLAFFSFRQDVANLDRWNDHCARWEAASQGFRP